MSGQKERVYKLRTSEQHNANPPENELANLWAKKRGNTTIEDTSIKINPSTSTRDVKKATGPAENELANVFAKKKNLSTAEDGKTEKREESRADAPLRVLPPCVRASQQEDALLAATNLSDMQETFETTAVKRQRPKSIKIGSTELLLEGSGGKGQALFMKMAQQTNPN